MTTIYSLYFSTRWVLHVIEHATPHKLFLYGSIYEPLFLRYTDEGLCNNEQKLVP